MLFRPLASIPQNINSNGAMAARFRQYFGVFHPFVQARWGAIARGAGRVLISFLLQLVAVGFLTVLVRALGGFIDPSAGSSLINPSCIQLE